MTEFDFHQLVREVLNDSDEADPRNLWKLIFERIPESEYGSVLDIVAPAYIHNQAIKARPNPAPKPTPLAPAATRRGRSYAATRRLFVGEWKFLADCTPSDLDVAVQLRHDHADAITAEADKYERLAKLCRDRGVATVGELPEEDVEEALK